MCYFKLKVVFDIGKQKNIKFLDFSYWFLALHFIHLLHMINTRQLNWWCLLTINT